MGIDPNSGAHVNYRVVWPGAMAILAGIDLLAKFLEGDDKLGKVGDRFCKFLKGFFIGMDWEGRQIIFQLRNALLHSFGLYSKAGDREYRFLLTCSGQGSLINRVNSAQIRIDVRVLHSKFEEAIAGYQAALEMKPELQINFSRMFAKYGRVFIS